jgi:HEAT repeat protein
MDVLDDRREPATRRMTAAIELGLLGQPAQPAASLLLEAARDPNRDLRDAALAALLRIGPESAALLVPLMLEALQDEQHVHAAAARETLFAIGQPAVAPTAALLMDEDGDVRDRALLVLHDLGPAADEAVPSVAQTLTMDSYLNHRELSALVLARIGEPSIAVLVAKLLDPDEAQRESHLRATWFPDEPIPLDEPLQPALRNRLVEESADIRRWVAEALAGIGAPVVEPVATVLRDAQASPEARAAAAAALGRLGQVTDWPPFDEFDMIPTIEREIQANMAASLSVALDDPSPLVRAAAAWGLSSQRPSVAVQALPNLRIAAGDPDSTVREAAAAALMAIDPNGHSVGEVTRGLEVPALERQLEDPSWQARSDAIEALRQHGSAARSAGPSLVRAIAADPQIAQRAVLAILEIGADVGPAVPILVAALEHEQYDVRREAVLALGAVGPPAREAAPALLAAIRRDPDLGQWIVQAIRATGEDVVQAVPVLIDLLEREPNSVGAAATALGEIGPEARDAIAALLTAREKADVAFQRPLVDSALQRIDASAARAAGIE